MSDVTNNRAQNRYELAHGGETAVAEYTRDGDTVTFTHTVVPKAIDGQGVGSRLIEGALDDVAAGGGKVVPQCPFVAHVIEETPRYQPLVT